MEKLPIIVFAVAIGVLAVVAAFFINIGMYFGDHRPRKGTAECTAAQEAIFNNPAYYMNKVAGQIVKEVNDACK